MVITVLEAVVAEDRADDLRAAYSAASKSQLPPGLVRTELLRDARDATRWRIQTLWSSREALDRMRGSGTPAGVLMFRAAGAEPTLTIFEVEATIPDSAL